MSEFIRPPIQPVITGTPQAPAKKPAATPKGGQSFQTLFSQALSQTALPKTLTLSKHAQLRVEQRGIELSEADMERMEQAVEKAREKGITDSLIFMNNTAFIVNIPNSVVVTLVNAQQDEEAVFTNIDGAVIL